MNDKIPDCLSLCEHRTGQRTRARVLVFFDSVVAFWLPLGLGGY